MAGKEGFTLLEVVLVILIVAVIAGIAGSIIMQGAESYSLQYHRRGLMSEAKSAISRMDKDIRMINSITATDITIFTASDLEFVDINGYTVRFSLSGPNIIRTQNGIANILCKDVSALTFSYFKKDGTQAIIADDIWTISIELTVSGEETISLRTRIFPRGAHGQYSGWKEV